MSLELFSSLAWVMTICSGLMAGVYLTFSVVIMRSLAMLDTSQGIAAMNSINREIVKTAFMPLFFGSTIIAALMVVAGIWQWDSAGAEGVLAAGLIYFFGMFVTTATANVPLNNQLDRVEGEGEEARQMWATYLSSWTRWNSIRAAACTATMIICIALLG